MSLPDQLQLFDPLPPEHRDVWTRAMEILTAALLEHGCGCVSSTGSNRTERDTRRHAPGCPYRTAVERARRGHDR